MTVSNTHTKPKELMLSTSTSSTGNVSASNSKNDTPDLKNKVPGNIGEVGRVLLSSSMLGYNPRVIDAARRHFRAGMDESDVTNAAEEVGSLITEKKKKKKKKKKNQANVDGVVPENQTPAEYFPIHSTLQNEMRMEMARFATRQLPPNASGSGGYASDSSSSTATATTTSTTNSFAIDKRNLHSTTTTTTSSLERGIMQSIFRSSSIPIQKTLPCLKQACKRCAMRLMEPHD
jgi:hypothetical protein